MDQQSPEDALFKDLATALDHWMAGSIEALTDPNADLSWCDHPDAFRTIQTKLQFAPDQLALSACMSEILRGVIHSVLVTLDGGTKMAESHALKVITEDGIPLSGSLHEGFIDYLIRSGRLE
jgi:hypothetical protein